MESKLENAIKHLKGKADVTYKKALDNLDADSRTYDMGYMSGLEYAAHTIEKLLQENTE